jgi:AcrR family transcriptional regulator
VRILTGVTRARGRPALPLDRILAAALDIIDEQGADALSMRSLAQRLGSGTATLYRHFANRSELVGLMVERVLAEADFDGRTIAAMPWQEACVQFARRTFAALSRHHNVASLLVGHVPMGPNALAGRELCLSVLLANGFRPQDAARAYATLARYVLGFAIQLPGSSAAAGHDANLSDAFHRLDPARYPATVAVADNLPVPLADEFEFGLELVIAGLEAGLARLQGGQPTD